ncbi:hypothetical protein BMF77_04865 [Dolichospermum sp. UHCC 0315A]|nr:hypothetical protein BMF77_04865 [Dolichospermum sp. UHCC 0315A]
MFVDRDSELLISITWMEKFKPAIEASKAVIARRLPRGNFCNIIKFIRCVQMSLNALCTVPSSQEYHKIWIS